MNKKFEFLEHTADIKFRVYGKTFEEALQNVSLAISNYICKRKVEKKLKKNIRIFANDKKSMLYLFIDELIFLLDKDSFVPGDAKISIQGKELNAKLYGDNIKSYKNAMHVKAATYSDMYIEKNKDKWEIQFVLDV